MTTGATKLRSTWRYTSVFLLMLGLAGCSNLLTSRAEAPVTYVIRPAFTAIERTASAPTGTSSGIAVQLIAVDVAPGYATANILATRPDRVLDVFAASRWADELPRVVGDLALEALRVSGGLEAFPPTAPVATTHALRLSVRRFDAEYRTEGAAPVIRVLVDAVVTRRSDRQAIGSFTVDLSIPASANRMSAIVAAFEKATGSALERVAEGTKGIIEMAPDRHRTETVSP